MAFEMPQDLPWVHQQQMLLQYSADETFQIGPEEKRNPRHKGGKKQPEAAPIGRPGSFQQAMARLNRRLDLGRTQEIFDRFRTPGLPEKRFQSRFRDLNQLGHGGKDTMTYKLLPPEVSGNYPYFCT